MPSAEELPRKGARRVRCNIRCKVNAWFMRLFPWVAALSSLSVHKPLRAPCAAARLTDGHPVSARETRIVIWSGVDTWRTEVSHIGLTPEGIHASGTQVGVEPVPYRLDYRLAAPQRFVTRRLEAEAVGDGWLRRIDLRHDGRGRWMCDAHSEGAPPGHDLAPAGGDTEDLSDALDGDLGLSPLTNLMPVRRHALDRHPGGVDFLMAWVSVPDLSVFPSRQRYEHVRRTDQRALVRYLDLGAHSGFVADLLLDADGLVLLYPELARRVAAPIH